MVKSLREFEYFYCNLEKYRSVPLVLVALLREYAYSADLPWVPKFSKKKKKKKKKIFFFFFFKNFFFIFPNGCLLNY